MRKGPTSDAQERIFSWFALSLMPFLSIAISGGVLGLGNMVFTAALTAGVLQLLLIYGMLGITGTYRLAGNALRDLVLLLVCVVLTTPGVKVIQQARSLGEWVFFFVFLQ